MPSPSRLAAIDTKISEQASSPEKEHHDSLIDDIAANEALKNQ